MRVIVINHEFPPVGGGAGTACYHTCRELVRMGVEVDVVTTSYRDLPRSEILEGIAVHRVPALRHRPLESTSTEIASFFLSASAAVSQLVTSRPPDLVHAYFGLPSGAIAWSMQKLHRLPYLISFRGRDVHGGHARTEQGIQGPMRWLSLPVWGKASALVANSTGLRDIALDVMPGAAVDVIPNGVDTDSFSPASAAVRPQVNALYVGRLEPYKGVSDLIEALSLVDRSSVDVHLTVVGDGSRRDKLRRLVAELGLESHVDFAGQVDRADIPAVYRSADVLVLPSIVEGMPNTVLEGMASGLPILATRIPGSEELVDEGNGILVPPSSARNLADGLQKLAGDRDLRVRLGKTSREKAMRRSWRHVAEQYVSVYDRMLEGRRRCAA